MARVAEQGGSAADAFFVMWRSRRAYFRRQSLALYLRYANVVAVLLALFGLLLVDRPALLAEPVLHFWRERGSLLANVAWGGTWLATVGIWVRIHRGFIKGGALAIFTRSLPQAVPVAPLVDAAMLFASLPVFLLPAGLAAWTVVAGAGGAGGWFPVRAALLMVLSLGVAQWAAAQVRRTTLVLFALGFLVLAGLGQYGAFEPAMLLAATLLVAVSVARDMLRPLSPRPEGRALAASSALRLPGMAFLVSLQADALVRRHQHAALPRIGLAIAVQLACLWMIFGVGKVAQAPAFIKVGCWITVGAMSGFFHLFWTMRQPIQPFLRSLPHGVLRMALSEQLFVAGMTVIVFAVAYGACLLQPGPGEAVAAQLLRHGAASLAALPLLALPVIQSHKDGLLLKLPILVVTFLLL